MLNTMNETQVEKAVVLSKHPEETRRMRAWLEEKIAAGKKKPIAEVVTVTPVLAQLLLDRNPINRPFSARNKSELKQDLAKGQFTFNGESIVVSNTGKLNDGQHRCATVVETGIPIQTVIVFGPDEDSRFTVDIGKSKSASNFLAMQGRAYTHVLAAAVGYIIQWRERGGISLDGSGAPTKTSVLKAADELKGIDESVAFTQLSMKTVRSHAVLAFCHYAFWKKSGRAAADEFITKLIEGDGLRKGDPILYCRNRLIGLGREVRAASRIELIFKCWNAYRLETPITYFALSGKKIPKLAK